MNTNETNTGVATAAVTSTQKKLGRPIVPTATKVLKLNTNFVPMKKGAPKVGSEYVEVTVHRKVNASNYVHGTTPIVGEPVAKVVGARKPRTPKAQAGNVAVNVIQPEAAPAVPAESAPAENTAPVNNPLV